MFKLLTWGVCAILVGMATLIYILRAQVENLKGKRAVLFIAAALILASIILFLLSFQTIRAFVSDLIPGYYN